MNHTPTHKTAQAFQQALLDNDIDSIVLELPDSTRSARDAASAIGCTLSQIVKSILFVTTTTQQPILVLASGVNRIDENIISAHCNETILKADANACRHATGFAIGGAPPFLHKIPITTFIDADLCAHEQLWAAAGTPHAVFSITPDELIQKSAGTVITLKK